LIDVREVVDRCVLDFAGWAL